MKFMNDKQRKAAFRNMSVPKTPSVKQINTPAGLGNLGKEMFGFDGNASALSKLIGKSGAFDHLKK